MSDLAGMAIFSIPCILFGVLICLAVNRWVKGWSPGQRFFWSLMASIFPVFAITCFAFTSSGNTSFAWSYAMDSDFLKPFGIQIAMILMGAGPVLWLMSRSRIRKTSLTNIFE